MVANPSAQRRRVEATALALGLFALSCTNTPSRDDAGQDGGGDAHTCPETMRSEPGLATAAASDEPQMCSFCDPSCFDAIDTIRGVDVAARGSGGLVPGRTGGAENPTSIGMCASAACATSTSRGMGASTPWTLAVENAEGVSVDADGALVLEMPAENASGHHRFVVMGDPTCGRNRWSRLTWEAATPDGTTVTLFARVANREDDLSSQPWIGPFASSPADLTSSPGPVPAGRFLEVDVRMTSRDAGVTPRVGSVAVEGACDPLMAAAGGTYTRIYDTTRVCDPTRSVLYWNTFTYDAWDDRTGSPNRRTSTYVEFQFRSANSVSSLATAPFLSLRSDEEFSPIRALPSRLEAAGVNRFAPYMEVRAILRSTVTPAVDTAILRSFAMNFTCGGE